MYERSFVTYIYINYLIMYATQDNFFSLNTAQVKRLEDDLKHKMNNPF